MENTILNKANKLSELYTFTEVVIVNKSSPRTGALIFIKKDEFNFWMSSSTGKIYADDNNGNWYTFK